MFHSSHCIEPFIVKAALNLTAIPSNRTETQYSKFINIWFAIPLQSTFPPQYTINVYAEYLHYSRSVASKPTLTRSFDVYSHTQHTDLRSFITWQLISTLCMGHHQAIIQEHKCTHKLNTKCMRSPTFTLKIHLKMYIQCIKIQSIARGLWTLKTTV